MSGPHMHARRAAPRNFLLKLPPPLYVDYDSKKWFLLLVPRLLMSIEDGPLVLRNLCVVFVLHVFSPGCVTGEGGPLCQLASHERLCAVRRRKHPGRAAAPRRSAERPTRVAQNSCDVSLIVNRDVTEISRTPISHYPVTYPHVDPFHTPTAVTQHTFDTTGHQHGRWPSLSPEATPVNETGKRGCRL